jgi:hypothetical protein
LTIILSHTPGILPRGLQGLTLPSFQLWDVLAIFKGFLKKIKERAG